MAASVKVANGMATTNRLDALRLRLVAGETAQEIGARIRVRRLELGLNQRELADQIPEPSVGNQRISDWERGVHQPSERYLRMLASALKVEVAYFYGANTGDPVTPPLMNLLEGGEERADELVSTFKRLVARIETLEQTIVEFGELLEERLPAAAPSRRQAGGK